MLQLTETMRSISLKESVVALMQLSLNLHDFNTLISVSHNVF